jgi:hypothetical protein
MVFSESVIITHLTPAVGSFCIVFMMVSCSALNIDLLSFFVLIADRLRPRILLFLPSMTRRCRSLCGRCILRLPVLRIRRGIFRLALLSSFYRETNPYFPHHRCTMAFLYSWEFSPLFFHRCSFVREVLHRVFISHFH